MTVFKTFLKVLNKNKMMIIIYSVMLVVFSSLSYGNNESTSSFEAKKPDILIINEDNDNTITNNLVDYLSKNCNIEKYDNENDIDDALFYRDLDYVINIPNNYRNDFIAGNNPEIDIKSNNTSNAVFANNILKRYIKVANIYQKKNYDDNTLVEKINNELTYSTDITIAKKLDTTKLSKVTGYYNFLSYSLLAGAIFVVCMVLNSFYDLRIKKRTIVSSTNYKKFNRQLFLSNIAFILLMWFLYTIVSIFLCGNIMFTIHGLMYMINSLVFTICTLSVGFLIINLIHNKNAINGIVNVIALGSSFMCGAFVPMEWLPKGVVSIARVIPTYWYINNNEVLKTLEINSFNDIIPLFKNMIIVIIFSTAFIIITNFISKRKRIID